MKVFIKPEPTPVLRVRIYDKPSNAKYITLCEIEAKEFLEAVKRIIEGQSPSPFSKEPRITVEAREGLGAKNGKSQSISFKGVSLEKTAELVSEYIAQCSSYSDEPSYRVHQKSIEPWAIGERYWQDCSELDYNRYSGDKRILYKHF